MKHLLVILILGFNAMTVLAQTPTVFSNDPGGPGISGGGNIGFTQDVNAPTLPFDGRLSLLLLASGIAFVGYKKKGILATT